MTFYAVVLLMAIKTVPFGEDTNLGDLFRLVGTPTGEIAFCCKRLLFNHQTYFLPEPIHQFKQTHAKS